MTPTTTDSGELLRQAHASLLADLKELSDATANLSLPALRTRLQKTRQDLIEHFRLEENNGYLDAVRTKEPCLTSTLKKLSNEHRQLLQALDDIVGQLEFPHPSPEVLQRRVRLWVHEVRGHEIRENELIQDAFLHDLGVGD